MQNQKKAESFKEIRDKFWKFPKDYFREFGKVTQPGCKISMAQRMKRINELQKIRGQATVNLADGLPSCQEALVHKRIFSSHDSAVYENLKRVDDSNIPEANIIGDQAEIFNAICNYFEITSHKLDIIEKNSQYVSGYVPNNYKKPTAVEKNIGLIVQEQRASQAVIKSPVVNGRIFDDLLAEAQKAYDLSEKEKKDFEKAVLGFVAAYLYYSREKRVVYPTAESDAVYKTDMYLVKKDISSSDNEALLNTNYDAAKIKDSSLSRSDLIEILQIKCTNFPLDHSIELCYDRKSGFEVRYFTNSECRTVKKTTRIEEVLPYLVNSEFQEEAKEYLDYCVGNRMSGRFTIFRLTDAIEIKAEA